MIRSERKRQGGFTLLEMLIAMAVFAVMSMVAYQGLRAVLDASPPEQAQRLADLQVTLMLERIWPRWWMCGGDDSVIRCRRSDCAPAVNISYWSW